MQWRFCSFLSVGCCFHDVGLTSILFTSEGAVDGFGSFVNDFSCSFTVSKICGTLSISSRLAQHFFNNSRRKALDRQPAMTWSLTFSFSWSSNLHRLACFCNRTTNRSIFSSKACFICRRTCRSYVKFFSRWKKRFNFSNASSYSVMCGTYRVIFNGPLSFGISGSGSESNSCCTFVPAKCSKSTFLCLSSWILLASTHSSNDLNQSSHSNPQLSPCNV